MSLHGPAVELQAARCLLIALGARVNDGAVAPEKLLRGEAALPQLRCEILGRSARRRRRWAVLLAHQHVADALLQLADVAGPGIVGTQVALDAGQHLVGELRGARGAHDPLANEHHQVAQLLGRVPKLLAERRGNDQVRAEPVVEVLAEPAGPHFHREVAVGGRDQLALERPRRGLADARELARLQDAQQLDLNRGVDLPHLVEQHRAEPRTRLEPADAILHGAGEGALAVAEQLRLDERGRQRGHVQRVERPVEGCRELLPLGVERDVAGQADRARDELLAGPRRSRDKGRDVVHPVVERAPVPPHVVGEDRLPDRGAQPGRGRGGAHDVTVDQMEGAPDLVEAGKQVRRVDALRQLQPIRQQEVLEVAPERPVARCPPFRPFRVEMDLVQRIGVALVQREDDERRIEAQLGGGHGGTLQQALAGVARRAFGDHADSLQARALRSRLGAQAPDRAGGSVAGAENLPFSVDELRRERVGVGDPRQRFDGAAFLGSEERHGTGRGVGGAGRPRPPRPRMSSSERPARKRCLAAPLSAQPTPARSLPRCAAQPATAAARAAAARRRTSSSRSP